MPSRNKVLWPIVAILVLAALVAARMLSAPSAPSDGGGGGEKGRAAAPKSQGDGGKNAQRRLEVAILVLKPQPLARKVLSSGTLLAREEVDLKSEAQGRIIAV